MRSHLAISTALLLLIVHQTAGSRDLSLVIESYPPGARIMEGDQFLGLTGQPIRLSQEPHRLSLRLENHESLDVSLLGPDLDDGRYPKDGPLVLKPVGTLQVLSNLLRYRPWTLVALALLSALVLAAARQGLASRRRMALLEALTPEGPSGQRSLIMSQVGNYRVISPLGQGGIAEVYLAVPNDSLDMSAAVAIKLLSREMRERSDLQERFEREVVMAQELTHPGIVAVRDWGWHQGRLYMVMELIEGVELRRVLPDLREDWPRMRDLLSQLMVAVNHAHERGISHRDLKPENVMIDQYGRAKVMDFGMGRAVDSATLTQAGTTLGTPRYVAPETVAGRGGDDLSDQYSLGVMAFEMVTGRAPFDSDEMLYLLYCHANVGPPAPSSLAPHLPPGVDTVILRMLEKDPRARYPTVEAARVELLTALSEL